MTLIRRNSVLAASIEATSGTIESLDASDAAFNVFNAVMNPTIDFQERPVQGSFSHLPGVLGARGATCTFSIELTGDGAGGVPGWASTFLPACGWTVSTGVFSPKSEAPGSNVKTLTIGLYENGRRKIMRGAAGTFTIEITAGQIIMLNFTFTGVWGGVTDTAILSPTYPTATPIRAAAATFTIGSVTPCFEQFSIDAGNNVILRPCIGNADNSGYVAAMITDRRVTASTDPEAKLVATDDRYGRWLAYTTQALSMAFDDGLDIVTLAAPAAQIVSLADGDRNGLRTDATEFQFCRSSGNDEFTITFAAS